MSNSFGNLFRFTIFGQSHAPAIGVCIEGLPSGFEIDMDALSAEMNEKAEEFSIFRISEDENVLPMIKPGQTYETIMTEWEEK